MKTEKNSTPKDEKFCGLRVINDEEKKMCCDCFEGSDCNHEELCGEHEES